MSEAPGTTAKIAIVLSLAAVIAVGVAVVVVATREAPPAMPADAIAAPDDRPDPRTVRAVDLVQLEHDGVEVVADGIKVTDRELARALLLEPDDVITSISGKSIKRQFDVYDALLGVSMMNATTLYLEIKGVAGPRLVRWQIDGDLRDARKHAARR